MLGSKISVCSKITCKGKDLKYGKIASKVVR